MQKSPSQDPFLNILNNIAVELEHVNQVIAINATGDSDLVYKISNHLIFSKSKKIRPILTILCAKLCGYVGDRHCNLAAAVELIHTATLLHDDVVDGSELRRGKESANKIWGNKSSILVGDYLLSIAFQLMVKDGSLEVLDILSKSSGSMADGELMQLMNSNNIEISIEKYLQIISCKTAVLFAAATKIGSIIANSNSIYKKALADFGNNLGIAFQIMDDVLDYKSSQDQLGKKIGNDFFEGKITLPVIIANKMASQNEKVRIKEIFSEILSVNYGDDNQSLFTEMLALIDKYNAMKFSVDMALHYKDLAFQNLNVFAESIEKSMLLDILEYSISRKN